MQLTSQQWISISSELEFHHAIFYQLWQMGRPQFTDEVKTAAVSFDNEGDFLNFYFNPEFWESVGKYERLFTICHEALHIIFNHGIRTSRDPKAQQLINIATDLVVNHTLLNKFGFIRDKLKFSFELCWVDTIFSSETIKEKEIVTDGNFEYYLLLLQQSGGGGKGEGFVLDEHDSFSGSSGIGQSDWEQIINRISDGLGEDEKGSIQATVEQHTENDSSGKQAGTSTLSAWQFVDTTKVKRKKKWESVIKKWSLKYKQNEFDSVEQWARLDRRYSMLSRSMFLPSEVEQESWSEDRIQVWFFQDTSGSCMHLKDRFFCAARSLDPKRFDIKLHTFDTKVYETSLDAKKLRGWGGTFFHILEEYIQQYCKKTGEEYPRAVFVITDGYGNHVKPFKPENWYWFLTTNATYCIPSTCNIYSLSDYE